MRLLAILPLISLVVLASHGQVRSLPTAGDASAGQVDRLRNAVESFRLPPLDTKALKAIKLWATRFYVYPAISKPDGTPLLDRHDRPLGASLSLEDWCLGGVQGTIRVGGMTYNVVQTDAAAQADCRRFTPVPVAGNRYAPARGPFGDGPGGFGLVPWRTIAVDPEVIPLGSVLFVPKAVGRRLPDGRRHDGYFFAGDTGGPIHGNHIDLFSGLSRGDVLGIAQSDPGYTLKAYVVTDPEIVAALRQEHESWVFGSGVDAAHDARAK